MADFLALLAIGIPATAVAAFALFLVFNRGRLAVLQGRGGDLLVAALLILLAGHLAILLGLSGQDPNLGDVGWLGIGAGFATAFAAAVLLIRAAEVEQAGQSLALKGAAASRSQVAAISRAAEGTGTGLLLVETSPEGEDRVTFCNTPAADLMGLRESEVKGRPLEAILAEGERATLTRLVGRARAAPGEPISAGFTLAAREAGAARIPVEIGLTFEPGEGASCLAVTLVDARAKRTAIAAARDARSDADFYLDLVTHDLSNFNQGALGYLELIDINRDASQERVQRFQGNALKQIRNSARLIENVKLLSVIRDTREPLGPIDALYALHDAIDHVVFSWSEKDVEVRLVPTTEAHMVRADVWLRDLFSNLLDNAVRFSPEKRVEVAVSVADSPDGASLVFRIADSGRGISPEEREIILDRLASRKRDYSAYRSGIGLFIVKTVADRYGGRLWIEDRVPGEYTKGSVFCLELPKR